MLGCRKRNAHQDDMLFRDIEQARVISSYYVKCHCLQENGSIIPGLNSITKIGYVLHVILQGRPTRSRFSTVLLLPNFGR